MGSRKGLDGRQVQRGTPEYRDSIIKNMNKKVKEAKRDDRYGNDEEFTKQVDALVKTNIKLKTAQDGDELISSKKVSQKLHKDGSLAKTKTSDFSNKYTKKDGI